MMLCVALIGGTTYISAQNGGSDKILVSGKTPLKQSDVKILIEFHEWIFDVNFTADERAILQGFVVKEYRRNPAATRRSTDEILETYAQVRALDANKQKQLREMTISGYLDDLRSTAEEEDSQFLLGIYKRAQTGDNFEEANNEVLPKEQPSNSKNSSATSLVGKWKRSAGAGGSRDYTGKTLYNSGDDRTFEFFADGTMQFLNEKNTLSITQCRIAETTKISGRYSVSGDQLTMNLGAGSSVGTSSCNKKDNFKKTLSASSITKTFAVKNLDSVFRPDAPLILFFDGNEEVYYERVK